MNLATHILLKTQRQQRRDRRCRHDDPINGICPKRQAALLLRFAALISDCTTGLAGRLAGCLAFAAAALFHCVLKILGI